MSPLEFEILDIRLERPGPLIPMDMNALQCRIHSEDFARVNFHTFESTFTQGLWVCAEEIPDVGTVLWMDTEGDRSFPAVRCAELRI